MGYFGPGAESDVYDCLIAWIEQMRITGRVAHAS